MRRFIALFLVFCLSAWPAHAEYTVGPGDTLSVSILGHPELSHASLSIGPDGRITLPLLGSLVVEGLTLPALSARLNQAYAKHLNRPSITVSLAGQRPIVITLTGQVQRPGSLDAKQSLTLLEAIGRAGGLSDRADPDRIQLIRAKGATLERQTLALSKAGHLRLQDRDTLHVPERYLAPRASGDSGFVLGIGDTVDVIVGGHPELSLEGQVVRPDGQISVPLVGQVTLAGRSVRDATLTLTEEFSRVMRNPVVALNIREVRPLRLNIVGEVRAPGQVDLKQGSTLLAAIARAGGLSERADAGAAYLLRVEANTIKRIPLDLAAIIRGQRQAPALLEGDTLVVPETWVPDWNRWIPITASAISAIILAISFTR